MKGLTVYLDGVKYLVKVQHRPVDLIHLSLFLNTMRGEPIYNEMFAGTTKDVNKFDVKKAKKFIKRSFEV